MLFVVIPYLVENQQSNKITTLLVITKNKSNSKIDYNGRCLSFKSPKSLIYIDNVFNAWTYGLPTKMRGVGGEV